MTMMPRTLRLAGFAYVLAVAPLPAFALHVVANPLG